MSERRSSLACFIIMLFVSSTMVPMALANSIESTQGDIDVEKSEGDMGTVIGDLSQFNPATGSEYLFIHEEESVVSATQFMRQAWIDAGRPGVEKMVIEPTTSGRAGARACSPHIVGDTVTRPISGGSVSATVVKTTNSVAFILQNGQTLSSTVLNNLASTWDQTIYPTMTTYYGKDYFDGRGLAPPDVDGNCQVEIIIYKMDGPYNTGGYFAPSFASTRESVYVDFDDITLNWGKSILAHELEHLLHNALDPYENLWIDEGNADVAIYLCFGADSTLISHVNAWTGSPELSVRWWNQRIADYGAGYMFSMYLAEHLGGGPAIRQLVQDSATGGAGVRNLALSPQTGQVGVVGRTMNEVFANFSIAATLDSNQGIYGYPNLVLNPVCTGGAFCRAQPADTNSDWTMPWSSLGNNLEGWGISSYKFTPGSASPAPLTIRATASVSQFEGVIVTQSMSDGLWSVTNLNFVNNVATGLIPGFGNLTDEVWVITWYASTVADCDYTSCGSSYPTASIDVEAARITSPATLALNSTTLLDRDGDGSDDTVEIGYEVLSNAFFEDLDIEIIARDGSGLVIDSITKRVSAGGGQPIEGFAYFTAPINDQYTFELRMSDMLDTQLDQVQTAPQSLMNMRPVANGSLSLTEAQTWENIQFLGGGFDAWGLSNTNNSLPYLDSPTAYAWVFGDNQSSNLKSPLRSYSTTGEYNVTLRVQDRGGSWSETEIHAINITDTSTPIPIITINNAVVDTNISVLTNQRILFSAGRTSDNVPIDYLSFEWDWGDGMIDTGIGAYSKQHAWGDIDSEMVTYNLTLRVFDGINTGSKTIQVVVNNRIPIQIFSNELTTLTYVPIVMPDVFVDDDGEIITYAWQFEDGARVGGGTPDRDDDYTMTGSSDQNPIVAWDEPGVKTVRLTVTDDDGSQATAIFDVMVLNQIPVASFTVRSSSSSGSLNIDFRAQDGEVDQSYTFDGRSSTDPDGTIGDSTDLEYNWTFSDGTFADRPQVTHAFSEPGVHTVTLVVTDEMGESSLPRTITVRIINPVPIIEVKILDGWLDSKLITDSTAMPEGLEPDGWSHTFNEAGDVITVPHQMLFFNSDGTRDGDRRFEGRYIPFEVESPDWNGLVEYTWDFGDATPLNHESSPWHAYELPGTYTVTLTVRDAFGTGDVTRRSFTVIVDSPPEILEIYIPESIFVGSSTAFDGNVSDAEFKKNVYRDLDVFDGSITEQDEQVSSSLLVRWDFNLDEDTNENGVYGDDWVYPLGGSEIRATSTWNEPGTYSIALNVCDGLGQCVSKAERVEVTPEPIGPPSLSDFSAEDWMSWAADAGRGFAPIFVLIVVALILGWLVMRQPTEIEEEAKDAAEAYNDVEMFQTHGSLLGMDHHQPPPAPRILSKEERRSNESGYIRPLRRR